MKKRLFLLIAALFAVNVVIMAQVSTCPITLEMYDTGGGGWESNRLNITYVNEDSQSVTEQYYVSPMQGDYSSTTLNIADGSPITITLTGPGSVSYATRYFKLVYDNGKVLYACMSLVSGYSHTITQMNCADKDKTTATVSVSSNINGAGVLTGGGDYSIASSIPSVTITATPNDGYLFENWTSDGAVIATTMSYTFDAEFDCEYQANFIPVSGLYVGNIEVEDVSDYLPGYSYYNYAISQQIYTADELSTGNINSISFYNGGIEKTRWYVIYLDVTDKTSFDDDTDWISIENAQLVYDNYITLSYGAWTTIDFNDAFTINDGENLCLTVFDYSEESDNEEDVHVSGRIFNAQGNQAIYIYDDNELDPNDVDSYTGTLMSMKNQIVLGYTSFAVNATAYPTVGGSVSGTGSYIAGETCTLTATPSSGYRFLGWMENDEIITHDNPYTFTVDGNRDLVAKFFTKHWTVVPVNGDNTMTYVGDLRINGVPQGDNSKYLELGAFIDDECRGDGLSNSNNKFVMNIGGTSQEVTDHKMVNFRVYNHLTEQEMNLVSDCDVLFTTNGLNLQYHFTFFSEFTVSAIINPVNAGVVTGTGSYQYGASAQLTATANPGYAFKCWKIGEDVVSTDISYTINPVIANITVEACFNYEYITPLAKDWNWWSTPIEVNGVDALTMLENSLGDLGVIIKSHNSFVYQEGGEWSESDFNIVNEKSYLINMSDKNGSSSITGDFADPDNHHIDLVITGARWTWVGYPVSVEQNVTSALSGFVPYENDLIKTLGGFAFYTSGDGWTESDEFVLTPGVGYMYHTDATEPTSLVYNNGSKNGITNNIKEYYWSYNPHAFADNMCIIATVYVEDVEQNNNNLEVGAFVNGECRGRSHLKYIASRDRYYALLTVSGQDGDMVEFGLVDVENNRISSESKTEVAFSSNAIIGEVKQPFEIKVSSMEAISRNKLNIFPNPVDRNTSVILNVPVDETIKEIVVTNTLGAVIDRKTTSLNVIENGMLVSGMYMVKVVCNSGNVYIGKLIVK